MGGRSQCIDIIEAIQNPRLRAKEEQEHRNGSMRFGAGIGKCHDPKEFHLEERSGRSGLAPGSFVSDGRGLMPWSSRAHP